jgi:hypothetical protein
MLVLTRGTVNGLIERLLPIKKEFICSSTIGKSPMAEETMQEIRLGSSISRFRPDWARASWVAAMDNWA